MGQARRVVTRAEEYDWLRSEVRTGAQRFAGQLGTIGDASRSVPNLDWTVGELAAHIVSMPPLYRSQHEIGLDFTPPDDWAAFSVDARAGIDTSDLDALGGQVEAAATELLSDLGDDPHRERLVYGQRTTSANVAAGFVAELLLHGQDLAALTGAAGPQVTHRHAHAAIAQSMRLAPAFVDRDRARKVDGRYHLGFRNGADYTWAVEDGIVTTSEGRPDEADARMRADALAFFMVSMGRANEIRAALTGKIFVFGRKPWRILALGNIRVEGV